MRRWIGRAVVGALAAMTLLPVVGVRTAAASTFAVTNANDSGPGSLRQAIADANASPGADTMTFAIPGDGPHRIAPATALPDVLGPTAIDARTQPGYAGLPLIELDGGGTVSPRGLNVSGADSLVAGLSIHGFVGSQNLRVSGARSVVVANHIGLGPSGEGPLDTAQAALALDASGAGTRVGGPDPADANVIAGGASTVHLFDASLFQGNVVSANRSGTVRLDVPGGDDINVFGAGRVVGNRFGGGQGVRIRGDLGSNGSDIEDNVFNLNPSGGPIASAQALGVSAGAGASNAMVRGNTFGPVSIPTRVDNGAVDIRVEGNTYVGPVTGLLVDLLPGAGRTANDPGDGDEGGNRLQNFPVIAAAGGGEVSGTLSSTPDTEFTIEVVASALGQPVVPVGTTTATTDGSGQGSWTVDGLTRMAAMTVVATATDPAGNTSEPSDPLVVTGALVVTNTNDSGSGSLRQAILTANALPGQQTIVFDIPGEGVHTIRPLSLLPEVTGPTAIDGRTQPGYAGLPLIELDGAGTVSPRGLNVSGADSLVAGLSIHGFVGFNQMWVHGARSVVVANHIGTGPMGTELDAVQPLVPLQVQGSGFRVGGPEPEDGNVVVGGVFPGNASVVVAGDETSRFEGNRVGVNRLGTAELGDAPASVESQFGTRIVGNQFAGSPDGVRVVIASSGLVEANTFNLSASGGALDPAGQVSSVIVRSAASNVVVRHNTFGPTETAVLVEAGSTGNRVEGNTYVGPIRGATGVDLLPGAGRTANDVGDGDEGGNHLQNFPVVAEARAELVEGTLDSISGTTFIIEVLAGVPGQPLTPVGATTATTDGAGLAEWSLDGLMLPVGTHVVATATDPGGNTSEHSDPVTARATSTTVLVSSADPSTLGQAVTFTATVTPTPTGGTIGFTIDDVPYSGEVTTVSPGVASITVSDLAVGDHTVLATFSGDTTLLGSSDSLVQTVNWPAPTAADDTYSTVTGRVLTRAAPGVLGNDTAPGGHSLTASLDDGPANGSVTLAADGSFRYTPAPGFTGADAYTYTATDTTTGLVSAPATVTVNVNPVPHATITTPSGLFFMNGGSIVGTATGGPGVLGVIVYYRSLTGGPSGFVSAACGGCGSGATAVTWSYTPERNNPIRPGIYQIIAQAVDSDGNFGDASNVITLIML